MFKWWTPKLVWNNTISIACHTQPNPQWLPSHNARPTAPHFSTHYIYLSLCSGFVLLLLLQFPLDWCFTSQHESHSFISFAIRRFVFLQSASIITTDRKMKRPFSFNHFLFPFTPKLHKIKHGWNEKTTKHLPFSAQTQPNTHHSNSTQYTPHKLNPIHTTQTHFNTHHTNSTQYTPHKRSPACTLLQSQLHKLLVT